MEHDEKTAIVYCGHYLIYDGTNAVDELKPFGAEGNVFHYALSGDIQCIYGLIRSKALEDVGGFDENFPAAQDPEMWIRISSRYEAACVKENLVKVHRHGGDRVAGNLGRRLTGYAMLLDKYKEFYEKDKYAYWRRLQHVTPMYRRSGQYGKFLKSYAKMITLQPLRITANFLTLIKSFFPQNFMDKIAFDYPRLHSWLKSVKKKIHRWE